MTPNIKSLCTEQEHKIKVYENKDYLTPWSVSWETNDHPASLIPRHLWSLTVHLYASKRLPLDSTQIQLNPVHILIHCFFKQNKMLRKLYEPKRNFLPSFPSALQIRVSLGLLNNQPPLASHGEVLDSLQ
jgi:hypothetical protein